MERQVEINGRAVAVSLSPAAERALAARSEPLEAQMELYFSCLIRLKVHFRDGVSPEATRADNRLAVSFRPVMTAACGKDYDGDEPPVTDFPLVRVDAYTPRWLEIDHRRGKWHGSFGFRTR